MGSAIEIPALIGTVCHWQMSPRSTAPSPPDDLQWELEQALRPGRTRKREAIGVNREPRGGSLDKWNFDPCRVRLRPILDEVDRPRQRACIACRLPDRAYTPDGLVTRQEEQSKSAR